VLLSDEASQWLEYATSISDGKKLILYKSLFKSIHAYGIELAFKKVKKQPRLNIGFSEPEAEKYMELVTSQRAFRELLEAENHEEKTRILVEQKDFLLSDSCDELIADYMDEALKSKNEPLRKIIQIHQMIILDFKNSQ